MRVLILGAGGMVGKALAECGRERGHDLDLAPRSEVDIRRGEQVRERVLRARPEWIVNAAACTRVDDCEHESETAMEVNGRAVAQLADAAVEVGARLLQISTDYVFDGTAQQPYVETDPTAPASVYGRSKLEGELAALAEERNLVVRTSWIFGPGGGNFVATIARLALDAAELPVVADQLGAPTYSRFLARALFELAEREERGIVHYRNREPVTWFELAREVVALLEVPCRIVETDSTAFRRAAPRPAYSVLSVERFEALTGRAVEPWRDGLVDYLEREHFGIDREEAKR